MTGAFKHGDHICAFYDTEMEQLAVAAAYVADGLRRGERCLYVGDSRAALDRFRKALEGAGIDAAAMAGRGALIEKTKTEAHLIDGRFDCERMLRLLNEAVESALNDGFTGLRTCGDMSWLLDEAPGSSQVIEYEALLNQLFRSVRALGMCQYDRRRLPLELTDRALATHPSAVAAGQHISNPRYDPTIVC